MTGFLYIRIPSSKIHFSTSPFFLPFFPSSPLQYSELIFYINDSISFYISLISCFYSEINRSYSLSKLGMLISITNGLFSSLSLFKPMFTGELCPDNRCDRHSCKLTFTIFGDEIPFFDGEFGSRQFAIIGVWK